MDLDPTIPQNYRLRCCGVCCSETSLKRLGRGEARGWQEEAAIY